MSDKCLNSSDITISVNGKSVAFAQQCSLKWNREYKNISSYGESKVNSIAVGAKSYEITLVKLAGSSNEVDISTLSGFTVTFKKQGKIHKFKNCEWISLCENVENGKSVVVSAVIACPIHEVLEG